MYKIIQFLLNEPTCPASLVLSHPFSKNELLVEVPYQLVIWPCTLFASVG